MLFTLSRSSLVLATSLLLSVAISGCASQDKAAPADTQKTVDTSKMVKSGTLTFEGRAYNLIVGGTWGEGELSYNGRIYKFKAKTIGAGYAVGMKDVKATATVYNLNKASDFGGTYWGVKVAGTAGMGAGAANVQNGNDVVLEIEARSKGFAADIGAGVARIVVEML